MRSSINTYPERLLYPLKRVGKRGEGLWQRISWDEAYGTLATRIQSNIDAGHPERVALHQGRSRLGAELSRFLNAIGSPIKSSGAVLIQQAGGQLRDHWRYRLGNAKRRQESLYP